MTSRRSLLKGLGVIGAAGGLTWLSREPFPYAGCACVSRRPDRRRFVPLVAHCHAEGIEVSDIPETSVWWSE